MYKLSIVPYTRLFPLFEEAEFSYKDRYTSGRREMSTAPYHISNLLEKVRLTPLHIHQMDLDLG